MKFKNINKKGACGTNQNVSPIYARRGLYNSLLERTMTSIEKIKELRERWKAAIDAAYEAVKHYEAERYCQRVCALDAALAILEKPSNQEVEPKQAKPCAIANMCGSYINNKCGSWCDFYPPEG